MNISRITLLNIIMAILVSLSINLPVRTIQKLIIVFCIVAGWYFLIKYFKIDTRIKATGAMNLVSVLLIGIFTLTPAYMFSKTAIIIPLFFIWIFMACYIDNKFISRSSPAVLFLMSFIFLDLLLSYSYQSEEYISFMLLGKLYVYFWILFIMFYEKNNHDIKNIIYISLVFYTISCYFTITGCLSYPLASRLLATGSSNEFIAAEKALYKSMGIGGYNFIYSCVYLVFPAMMMLKYKKEYFLKIILGFFSALLVVTAFISSFTTATILALIFFFLPFVQLRKNTLITVLISFVVLLLGSEYILEAIRYFSDMFGIEVLSIRITQILTGTYASAEGNRIILFYNSLANIADSPILGTLLGDTNLRYSGHSALLGYLETYGLLGFIYIGYYIFLYRNVLKNITSEEIKEKYRLYCCTTFILLVLNTIDYSPMIGFIIFFLAPLMFVYVDKNLNLSKG